MSVPLRIDASDPTPPYEQLRRQIAGAIASGGLAAGTRLPTVRQLASDLGVAAGTVMRTYAELEAAGMVEARRGGGTLVAAAATPRPEPQQSRLRASAEAFVREARRDGVPDADIIDVIHAVLRSV